jgi:TusA-related sulfurtransferase
MTDRDAQLAVGDRLLRALGRRDFDAVTSCLDAQVRFRALLPPGLHEVSGAAEAASCFHNWFGAADRIELLEGKVEPMAQRVHLAWRLRVHEPGRRRLIEQHAFATVRGDRIVALDLVCSGFHPEESIVDLQTPRPSGVLRAAAVLQGGDANCATLTPLVKAKLGELASGEVLEILSSDPSAEADLASWSRLTGNPLLGARADGALRHFYVGKK